MASDDHSYPADGILKVGTASAPQAVATAISRAIFEHQQYPKLRAIGHGAVGQAVKAVAIARGYVAPRGIDLGVIIGFDNVLSKEGETISAIVLETYKR